MRGPGPSETTVAISTADGEEEVVVDTALVHGEELEVRRVLERTRDRALIELPRESASGRWRVWVPRSTLASA
jgi:hypothetical protein